MADNPKVEQKLYSTGLIQWKHGDPIEMGEIRRILLGSKEQSI